VFYLAIGGHGGGYLLGGKLSRIMVGDFLFTSRRSGFLLALAVLFLHEPKRGQFDREKEIRARDFIRIGAQSCVLDIDAGHGDDDVCPGRNPVWMPTFCRGRGVLAGIGKFHVRIIIVVDGILASLREDGWETICCHG